MANTGEQGELVAQTLLAVRESPSETSALFKAQTVRRGAGLRAKHSSYEGDGTGMEA